MKKLLLLLFVALLPGLASAQVGSPVPSTAYTRTFLRSPNQSNAWYNLGIVGTNQTQVTNWVTAIPSGVLIVDPTISVTATSPAAAYFPIGVPDATGGLMGTPDYLNVSRFNITNLTADTATIGALSVTMSNAQFQGYLTLVTNGTMDVVQDADPTIYHVTNTVCATVEGTYVEKSDDGDWGAGYVFTNTANNLRLINDTESEITLRKWYIVDMSVIPSALYYVAPAAAGPWTNGFDNLSAGYIPVAPPLISQTNIPAATLTGDLHLSGSLIQGAGVTQAFVQIFPDLHRIGLDGKVVKTPDSLTRGIQEAVDSLKHYDATRGDYTAGGRIVFAPGLYQTANTINVYLTNLLNAHSSIIFDGPGMTACAIVYTNNANPSNVIHTIGAGEFVMRDMTVASTQNTNAAIINGTMCNADIQNCMIGEWKHIYESGYWGFSAAASPVYNTTNNLIAITNWGTGPWMIRNSTFVELATGIFIGNDHTELEHCSFFGCGSLSETNAFNSWPTNNPNRLGGGVVITACAEFGGGGGNNVHNFFGNKFYWTCPLYVMAHAGLRALCSYCDSSEMQAPIIATRPAFVTAGQRFASINPMYGISVNSPVGKVISGTDWTALTNPPAGTFPIVDFANQTSTNWMAVCDGLILTTNTPASDASGEPFRVVTAGQGKFWNSNSALYWITSTKTNLIVDGQ